jgi:hypothetical protein
MRNKAHYTPEEVTKFIKCYDSGKGWLSSSIDAEKHIGLTSSYEQLRKGMLNYAKKSLALLSQIPPNIREDTIIIAINSARSRIKNLEDRTIR